MASAPLQGATLIQFNIVASLDHVVSQGSGISEGFPLSLNATITGLFFKLRRE